LKRRPELARIRWRVWSLWSFPYRAIACPSVGHLISNLQ